MNSVKKGAPEVAAKGADDTKTSLSHLPVIDAVRQPWFALAGRADDG
jgi:hypothetical protein